jgi:hypothetical protein
MSSDPIHTSRPILPSCVQLTRCVPVNPLSFSAFVFNTADHRFLTRTLILQLRQHEGFPHLLQLHPLVGLRHPADAPAHDHLNKEAEQARAAARQQVEAAAHHSASPHPFEAAFPGAVHLSQRQRVIYGQRYGFGHVTK